MYNISCEDTASQKTLMKKNQLQQMKLSMLIRQRLIALFNYSTHNHRNFNAILHVRNAPICQDKVTYAVFFDVSSH